MRFFEDIEIGAQREFGSFTFTADDIKKFATQFDPQRFHLDEEEGRKSLFGGLAASGWHVAAVCMKLLVADGKRLTAEAVARGEKVAVWGPSPGFRELRWIKPVLAGDTISFSSGSKPSGPRRSVPNGASCRPAIPASTSAARWCTRSSRPPSCRGGMRVEEACPRVMRSYAGHPRLSSKRLWGMPGHDGARGRNMVSELCR